jgi:hypothetical protein
LYVRQIPPVIYTNRREHRMPRSTSRWIVAATLAAVCVGITSGFAQEEPEEPTDLSAITCKEIMVLSGEDRDLSILFLHGYFVGKSGKTVVDSEELAEATDVFIDQCLDHPGAKALATMEAIHGGR